MATEIRVPLLGDVMKEGTLVKWFKEDQEWVEKGQPLFAIETDKATFEVEAPASGKLQLLAKAGDIVAVGGAVGLLWEKRGGGPPSAVNTDEIPPRASPSARRLARERGVDITQVHGTGPGERITEEDVAAYLERSPREDAAAHRTVIPLRGRRRIIADRMHASLHTAAQLTIGLEVDATSAAEFRAQLHAQGEERESDRVTYTDIIVKAAALALREHRRVNAVVIGDEIHLIPTINIALAVDTEEGLTVPVIRATDQRSLLDLARTARELADLARGGGLTPEHFADGSFTVSSLGSDGPDWFTPIINPPQVAILGIGRLRRVPALSAGLLTERRVVNLCLTFDHRALDGAPAARFLNRIAELLQTPQALI
jgi:pyruvate dehydrogenase E2 component (dihydrolipoamide acetyltransferase)